MKNAPSPARTATTTGMSSRLRRRLVRIAMHENPASSHAQNIREPGWLAHTAVTLKWLSSARLEYPSTAAISKWLPRRAATRVAIPTVRSPNRAKTARSAAWNHWRRRGCCPTIAAPTAKSATANATRRIARPKRLMPYVVPLSGECLLWNFEGHLVRRVSRLATKVPPSILPVTTISRPAWNVSGTTPR